jgi:glutaredoxin-like protein
MAFLNDKEKIAIKKRFEKLDKTVTLINFTQEFACQFCRETHQVAQEVAELSDKITLDVHDFQHDIDIAQKYNIDKIPAIVVLSDKDVGIRFYGIPSGYEFTSLLDAIEMVSTGITHLSHDVINKVLEINRDVHLQIFVTPTCPYCPGAVRTGHAMAFLNEHIKADVIELIEFPHLAQKYNVIGVPRVVINENDFFEGALPDRIYLAKIFKAVK